MRAGGFFGTALALLFASSGAIAAEAPELHEDLLHADVALWGLDHKGIWPVHFTDDDGSFGCTSRVRYGDWRTRRDDGDETWTRYENYGVFHCAVIERNARERTDLGSATSAYGFFVEIDGAQKDGKPYELWVFQSGTRIGSTYTLLAREPGGATIARFMVLQRQCPEGHTRHGPDLDVFGTSYCAVNSQADMVALARRMLQQPQLGVMEVVPDAAPDQSLPAATALPAPTP